MKIRELLIRRNDLSTGGPKRAFVVTEDDEKVGSDSAAVHQKIKERFG